MRIHLPAHELVRSQTCVVWALLQGVALALAGGEGGGEPRRHDEGQASILIYLASTVEVSVTRGSGKVPGVQNLLPFSRQLFCIPIPYHTTLSGTVLFFNIMARRQPRTH